MMAANIVGVEDEESLQYLGSRIQPFPSAPRMDVDRKSDDGEKRIPNTYKFNMRLGLEDLFCPKVWGASIAGLVGTAILVFSFDTIIISSYETQTETPNLLISFLVFLSFMTLLPVISIWGGHINPVVSFSAMLLGVISLCRATIYILAQCVGAVLGALALKAVVRDSIERDFSLGGCTLTVISPGPNGPISIGIETGQALCLEIICTFIYLFTSVWIAFDDCLSKALGRVVMFTNMGIVVGLMVFVSMTVTSKKGYAGAGMNPARCIGPALVRGGHLWDGHWVFWVGPAIAGVMFYLCTKTIPRWHVQT